MTEQQYLYRVVGSAMPFYYEKYPIIKTTEKGHWIQPYYGSRDKFVRTGTRKCFAHPTLEEAYESFKYRKEFEAKILKSKLVCVNEVLKSIETISVSEIPTPTDFVCVD